MKRFRPLTPLATTILLICATAIQAQEPLVGKPAPPFELTDSHGKTHNLSDYRGTIVVLHFQSCACPWDIAYQPVLNRLARHFVQIGDDGHASRRIQFLGINANRQEPPEQIKDYALKMAIPYPILKDPSNRVADAYAAVTTPHIFVIGNDEHQTLMYKGGIEKAPLSPPHCGKSDEQYLEPVLRALLEQTVPPYSQTQSVGCSIKRVNPRQSRG